MCCIFQCFGWLIDVLQRAWTFSMTCIIMSAVSGVLATSAMSGIALGYNYSLAEYIDLKETNVSVYLKRGVFDDEIADDMSWRKSGNEPGGGQNRDDNLRTGAPAEDDSTTLRSGRRLDDSVFEADDHHKYEGSLMKLTAKPVYQDTPGPQITADLEMAESITKYPMGSLDQLKAIQSLIDSRRAMAVGGTTLSPLATYAAAEPILPFLPSNNNPNIPMHPEVQYRRMMGPGYNFRRNNMEPGPAQSQSLPELNPARLAVPDPILLQSKANWLGPKGSGIYVQSVMPEFFISSPTYPPPITVRPATVRPTVSDIRNYPESVIFPYASSPKKPSRTQAPPPMQPPMQAEQEYMEKQADFYNDKSLSEGEEISKNDDMIMQKMAMRSPEEEYEDEIKGLPVRKRRSIIVRTLVGEGKNPTERNIIQPAVGSSNTRNNDNIRSVKNIFTTTIRTTGNDTDTIYKSNLTIDKNRSVPEEINDLQISTKISNKDKTNQQMDINEKSKSNLGKQVEIIRKHDPSEDIKEKSLLDYFVKLIGSKEQAAETTPEASVIKSSVKKIRIKTRRKSFESKIVTNKYVPNNAAIKVEKKQQISNQEILNSISVGLNEADLLRNSSSSTFVKLLQDTLTT